MKNNLLQLAVASALCMTTLGAYADDMYRGAWYLLPGASILRTDSDLEAKHRGGGLFLKMGKEISPSWDIQGGLTYNRASEDTNIAGVGGHYKQISLGADALYLFSRQNFRPFLLVGGGIARNNVDYSNLPGLRDEMRTSWMTNVGLGAQLFFNDSLGVQLDLRRQWSRSDAKAPASGIDTSGTVGNTLLNIGGIFRFGAPAQQTAEATVDAAPPPPVQPQPAKAAPPPAAEMTPVAPPPPNCKPQFETISIAAEKLFGFDKIRMQEGAKPLLDEVIVQLKAHPEFELVMITGHTDRIGSKQYNQLLSEQRANQVKDYLVSAGIDANRLKSVGKGETEPKVSCAGIRGNALIECLQPNRRVVIEDEAQHRTQKMPGCP